MKPDIAVIGVTYNSEHVVAPWIRSIRAIRSDVNVIVVDNASADLTVDAARAAGADVVLPLPTNVGFGRACNVGAESAESPVLLFSNPDVELTRFENPEAFISAGGIAACPVAEADHSAAPDLRAETSSIEDYLNVVARRLLPCGLSRQLHPRRSPPRWVSGALFLISRHDFLTIGGFDSRFFLYFEDRDLARRAQARGLRVCVEPAIIGQHRKGGSSDAPNDLLSAWTICSWLEYLGIWSGQATADHYARLAVRTLAYASRFLGTFADGGVRRKYNEVHNVIRHISTLPWLLPDDGYLPHAKISLQRALPETGFSRSKLIS